MDAEEELRQAEVRRQLDSIIATTATELRAAKEEREAIAAVIRRFLDRSLEVLYHPSALWFEFGAVLDKAGFNAQEQDRRFRIYSTVSNKRFGDGSPLPPDWPWFENPEERQ